MSGTAFFVTGARGKTGREVVAQLADRGVPVRAGSSVPGDATGTVQPVLFDWDEPATWPAAVAGADAMYVMRPDVEDSPARVAELVALKPDAHVVLLSEQGAEALPETSWPREVERAVTDQATSWTVLRPSWFHQVLTDPRYYLGSIQRDGVLPLSSGGGSIAFVDARDIAAVAVAALLDVDRNAGAAYELTGPEALTVQNVADLVADASGRRVVAVDPSLAEALAGLPPWLVDYLGDVLLRVRDGSFGRVTDDVQRVIGRPATSVAQFTREHADLWRGALV